MFRTENGLVYTPADLGVNDIPIAPSAIFTSAAIVPWTAAFPVRKVTFICDTGPTGATPFNLLQGVGAWSPGNGITSPTTIAFISTFLQNFGNNPRVKMITIDPAAGGNGGFANSGNVLAASVPFVLGAPFTQFRIQNQDAVNAATNVFLWAHLQGN